MEIKLINVSYKNIFENLNLNIEQNQITSIIGKSGSGKSSLLDLIYGLTLDFNGEISIGRKKIDNKTKNKDLCDLRKNISYLSQEYINGLFNINVLEDIKYRVQNLDLIKMYELLKSFGLNEEIHKRNYFDLSDGQIKKILLISIILKDSKVILLDEPTCGLDQKSILTLTKILKKEKRNDKIIIVVSQDSEFLLNVSDRFIILDNGKVSDDNNKYEVLGNQMLLNKINLSIPNILMFREKVKSKKNIKLVYRDNINDLIKDIYRSAR